MTGRHFSDPSEGIWDDGEWISWAYIGSQIHDQARTANFPAASQALLDLFDNMVDAAREYKKVTGRYLPLFGELGELYAEIKFGIKRHAPRTKGSDGRIGNDFVEVKTISPEKRLHKVRIKLSGNFNKLVVVKISEDFEFDARMIDRSSLSKSSSKFVSASWQSLRK
jgi:hypothetical protein